VKRSGILERFDDKMVSGKTWDIVTFVCCVTAFLAYHVWYFLLRGTKYLPGSETINLWTASLKSRGLWAHVMMSSGKEGIVAVQTIRNMIISVSILAAAEAALASQMLNLLTDPARLARIQEYAESDPISNGDSFLSPSTKVALALGAVFLSFLIFAQCARIAVHLGFLFRVVPENLNSSIPLRDATIVLTQRVSLYFALGLRFLYAFVPLAFYMTLGSLALVISTGILLIALLLLDVIPSGPSEALLRQTEQDIAESSRLEEELLDGGSHKASSAATLLHIS